jgi:hypothetical protein
LARKQANQFFSSKNGLKKYELKAAAPLPVLKCRNYAGFWHFYPEMSSKNGVFWPKSGSAAAGSKKPFFCMLSVQG